LSGEKRGIVTRECEGVYGLEGGVDGKILMRGEGEETFFGEDLFSSGRMSRLEELLLR
jgi:hypothetical protein